MTLKRCSLPILLSSALLALGACSDKTGQLLTQLDRPAALVVAQFTAPLFGQTQVAGNDPIVMTLYGGRAALTERQHLLREGAVVEHYPGGAAVAGNWAADGIDRYVFTPADLLSPGDYVVRFPAGSTDPAAEMRILPRPYNLFRVGSALRLRQIMILTDKAAGTSGLRRIELSFSEASDKLMTLDVRAEQADGAGGWQTLAGTLQQTNPATLVLAVPDALDPQRALRITVSGPALDGAYQGVAGSGPAVAEFTPEDYAIEPSQIIYAVPPKLGIELPSGQPKPNAAPACGAPGRSCFFGSAYADCGTLTDLAPRVFCSPTRCLWVSDGCPLTDYAAAIAISTSDAGSCDCFGAACASMPVTRPMHFLGQYGKAPWNRLRAPLLSVTVDSTTGSQLVGPTCQNCGSACENDNPCALPATARAIAADTRVVSIEPAAGYMHGWRLEVEADLGVKEPVARLCRLPLTDALSCYGGAPLCASSGTVTITSADASAPFHGSYVVRFDDGVEISGAF